jgi:hypothetical protein
MKRREVRAKEKGKPSKRLPVDFNKRTDLLKQGKNFIQKVGINMQKSSDPNIQKAGIIIERLDDDVEKEILIEAYELNRASGDPERINEAIRKVLISKIKSGAITDEDTSWINQENIPFVPGL